MPAFFPILETLVKRCFLYCQQLLFRLFFNFVNHTLPFVGVFSFVKRKKSVAANSGKYGVWGIIMVLAKNSHTNRCVSWCIILVQNLWLVFPQFYALLTICFAQWAHNFKLVFLIDCTTLWQKFMMHQAIAIEENFTFTQLDMHFSVLALLDASIGIIGLFFNVRDSSPLTSFWRKSNIGNSRYFKNNDFFYHTSYIDKHPYELICSAWTWKNIFQL